ncbi:unnamed protein product [Blepharisma stoltei]|uniref:Uncharacterized protein n=1 Tax=Blepharisma stoltei TaxID=1481888 RepID=A0AAU9J3Y5_9CILI|nr:unnamed protein product [Blepharisma stoltei]
MPLKCFIWGHINCRVHISKYFEFAKDRRKILFNLIKCEADGKIYESGIVDEYTWKLISKSVISWRDSDQVYCY